jgi:DNA invertase Pin-like site-specific DNA recombinase
MTRTRKTAAGQFIAYYRVSDIKQEKSGLGLEAQRASVERYLQQVKGSLINHYIEVETAKGNGKNRPQLQAAIRESKSTGATLVIAKLDRLSRNVHFISGLMESAADFVACDMPAANKLTLHIMAAMAEHEREMISARTCAALEQVKARGVKLGNPRWQDSIQRALAARWPKRQASQVDAIIRDRHGRGETLRQIAGTLNDLGLKTPTGAQWHASSVRAALLRFPEAA